MKKDNLDISKYGLQERNIERIIVGTLRKTLICKGLR